MLLNFLGESLDPNFSGKPFALIGNTFFVNGHGAAQ